MLCAPCWKKILVSQMGPTMRLDFSCLGNFGYCVSLSRIPATIYLHVSQKNRANTKWKNRVVIFRATPGKIEIQPSLFSHPDVNHITSPYLSNTAMFSSELASTVSPARRHWDPFLNEGSVLGSESNSKNERHLDRNDGSSVNLERVFPEKPAHLHGAGFLGWPDCRRRTRIMASKSLKFGNQGHARIRESQKPVAK